MTDQGRSIVRYVGSGEWSALYVDGELDRIGDHYRIDERIAELLGVEVREGAEGSDFLRGGDGVARTGGPSPAQTLAEAEAYTEERDRAVHEADDMIRKADELAREAAKIKKRYCA